MTKLKVSVRWRKRTLTFRGAEVLAGCCEASCPVHINGCHSKLVPPAGSYVRQLYSLICSLVGKMSQHTDSFYSELLVSLSYGCSYYTLFIQMHFLDWDIDKISRKCWWAKCKLSLATLFAHLLYWSFLAMSFNHAQLQNKSIPTALSSGIALRKST